MILTDLILVEVVVILEKWQWLCQEYRIHPQDWALLNLNLRKGFSHLINWFRWYSVITSIGRFSAGLADLVAPLSVLGILSKQQKSELFQIRFVSNWQFRASRPKLSISTLSASSTQTRPGQFWPIETHNSPLSSTYSLLLLPGVENFGQKAEKRLICREPALSVLGGYC